MSTLGQHTAKGYTSANSTTTDAITLSTTTSVAVFAYWQQTSTPPTITDSKGNSLTFVDSVQVGTNAGGNWCGLWVGIGITGGSGYTVTAAKDDGYTTVAVVESPDATGYTADVEADPSAPFAMSLTHEDALVVGFFAPQGESALTMDGTANGFNELDEIGSFDYWQILSAYKDATAATTTFAPSVTTGTVILGAGLALVAFTAPSDPPLDIQPFTPRRHTSGSNDAFTAKIRVGGVWVPFLPKNFN